MAKRKKKRATDGAGGRDAGDGRDVADGGAPRPPKPPPVIGTSLKAALAGIVLPDPKAIAAAKAAAEKAEREKSVAAAAAARGLADRGRAQRGVEPAQKGALGARPSEGLRGDERFAYFEAIAGVRPLRDVRPARLGAVVKAPPPGPDPATLARDREARERLAALVGEGLRFTFERDGDEIYALREGTARTVLTALEARTATAESSIDLHGLTADAAQDRVSRFVRSEHRRGIRRVLIVVGKGLHSVGPPVLRDAALDALTRGGAAPLVLAVASAPPALGGTGALLVQIG